jgi:hypothetical protein
MATNALHTLERELPFHPTLAAALADLALQLQVLHSRGHFDQLLDLVQRIDSIALATQLPNEFQDFSQSFSQSSSSR